MHDYDAEFIWDYEISSHDYLDESYESRYTYALDDDDYYTRHDSTDYAQLAYVHYA